MHQKKTVLIIDDEKGFIEALEDALVYEGYNVLNASTAEEALKILLKEHVDLVTVDIMMPPGPALESQVASHKTGVALCRTIKKLYPKIDIFCISVVSDIDTIREVRGIGARFLSKGETPLRTVLNIIRSRLSGVYYSTETE